jgi:exodeoxyribonuclease V alpha subunit
MRLNLKSLRSIKPWLKANFSNIEEGKAGTALKPIDLELANSLCMNEVNLSNYHEPCSEEGTHSEEGLKLFAQLIILLSQSLTRGEVCLELNKLQPLGLINTELELDNFLRKFVTVKFIDAEEFNLKTSEKPYDMVINYPLVSMQGRLYFSRYWFYQHQVYYFIQSRLRQDLPIKQLDDLAKNLQQLFPEQADKEQTDEKLVNWQMVAAANACLNRFSVITGGPGTGKTTTVTRLLAALISQQEGLRIALAAPTGKAAARLVESILAAKSKLTKTFPLAEKIPVTSFTLHRLLGWRPEGFSYNHKKTLPYDLVIVDEASMVDLPMMAQLMEALADDTRLILLGDKDQLASVEAGSVLGDLCDNGVVVNDYPAHGLEKNRAQALEQLCALPQGQLGQYLEENAPVMANSLSQLRVSYRFTSDSGIGRLAGTVNSGRSDLLADVFSRFDDIQSWAQLLPPYSDFSLYPQFSDAFAAAEAAWQEQVIAGYGQYLNGIKQGKSPAEVLQCFNKFQLLCALRQGSCGLTALNERVVALLQSHGLLNKESAALGVQHFSSQSLADNNRWYPGRPVMITRNDYELNLFNGDIGIAMEVETGNADKKELRVCFIASDTEAQQVQVRQLLPTRLPQHETAFAMTVHKSQGSEFDDVALVLPENYSPVISRELIYTAITRAKKTFSLYAKQEVLQRGIQSRVERASGLRDLLF